MSGSQHPRVRVAELGGPAAGITAAYAGWLLSRMGAEVTRFGAASPAGSTTPVGLALEVLAEGKRIVAESGALEAALGECDILLCDAPQALPASVQALHERFPRLVIGCATTFGLESPYADSPATGLEAQALSAVAWCLGEPGRAPLTLPPGIAEHQAGAVLAAGALLALTVRDDRGTGRILDVSLADVLASYVAGNCRLYIHHGLQWQRSGRRASGSGGAYPYMLVPCADGEVCVCGRTRDEWNRLVKAMGSPAWAAEPRYQDLRRMGKEYPDEVDALVMPWFARHTKAELEAIALESSLIVSPIRTMPEVLATPQFRERGFFADGRAAGRTVSIPNLPFRVSETRAENAAEITAGLLDSPAPAAVNPAAPVDRPLDGLRVLDMGWVWSAPWVGTILAELGAQVIKVEHALRPDNSRLSGRVFRDGKVVEGPTREMSPMFHQINHGKLGITLNVKEPRAVALIKALAAKCDIVIENMSPGSMERSGLGYAELAAVNPRIVMLAMSAAGQFGSLAGMRAYAPTMSSFIGMEGLVGYPGEAPIGALNFALGDPNASVHALAPLLAALRRARATGRGAYIDFSQIESLLGTLRPYILDAQVRGGQPPTIGNRHPEMAPHGVFPAAGTDAWLTIAVADDHRWHALAALAPGQGWARDPRFRTAAGRLEHVAELEQALAVWTKSQPRDELVARLRAARIASAPVLSVEEQWREPHFAARAIKARVAIPVYGEEDLFKAPWRFSDFNPRIERCGPTLGEHNAYVFGELLGLPVDEIAALAQQGVIA